MPEYKVIIKNKQGCVINETICKSQQEMENFIIFFLYVVDDGDSITFEQQ